VDRTGRRGLGQIAGVGTRFTRFELELAFSVPNVGTSTGRDRSLGSRSALSLERCVCLFHAYPGDRSKEQP
jgi:hypothetical protein